MTTAHLDLLIQKSVRNLDRADWSVFVEVERKQLSRLMWVPRKFSTELLDSPYRLWANVRGNARFNVLQAS